MARGRSVIVGGGMGTAGALLASGIITLAQVNPPTAQIASPTMNFDRTTHVIISDGVTVAGAGVNTEGIVIAGNGAEFTNQTTTTLGSVILGNAAIARSTGGIVSMAVVIGHRASAINATAVAGATVIGHGATYTGAGPGVVIGNSASNNSQSAICIGGAASISTVTSSNSILIGTSGSLQGLRNTAIGDGVICTGGNDNIVIGQASSVAGGALRSITIGGTNTNLNDAVTLAGAAWSTSAFTVGGASTIINTVLFGKGNTSGTPNSVMIRITNGTGADTGGGNLTLQGGLSTGNAAPGTVVLSVGKRIAGSGSGLQTAYSALGVSSDATNALVTIDSPAAGTDNTQFRIAQAGTVRAILGVNGAVGGLIGGVGANAFCIRTETQAIAISTDGGTTLAGAISTGGVFTFNKLRGVRFDNQTSSAAAQAGTLGNAPTAGNPGYWLKINIDGTNYAVPCWLG